MKKVAKTAVNYRSQTARPLTQSRHCGNCGMYRWRQRTCDLVEGEIRPDAVCDRWIKKEKR